MSRLDLFVNRMISQRACLNAAAVQTAMLKKGPVFELGLGNGRTYHHMCEIMPDREIFVFERAIAAHPDSLPPDKYVFLGDVIETLPAAWKRFGSSASLVHADLGTHDAIKSDLFAHRVSPLVEPLLGKGAILISSDKMYFSALREMVLPDDAVPGRCFMYQC